MTKNSIRTLLTCLAAWLLISQASHAAQPTLFALPIGTYNTEVVPQTLAFANGKCPDVHHTPLKDNQVLAELLLLCKALQLGGITPQFEFKDAVDYFRIISNAGAAFTVMPSFTVWGQDINHDAFYVTSPILKKREFVKGLYTIPSNTKLLAIKDVSELKNYIVATNPNWTHDNNEINCIGFKSVNSGLNPILMARMAAAKRIDTLLFPFFNSADMTGNMVDVYLVPVPGVKVVFNDSLHFIVSKKHPQGLAVFQALEKGITALHENGTVRYTYEKLGFFKPNTQNWTELGCKK